jgi:hypothetical protein
MINLVSNKSAVGLVGGACGISLCIVYLVSYSVTSRFDVSLSSDTMATQDWHQKLESSLGRDGLG